MIQTILELPAFRMLLADIQQRKPVQGLGLPRAVRLPLLAALAKSLDVPILFITDRMSHALTQVDELGFWLPDHDYRLLYPEPNPHFYEQSGWGNATRKDRITVLSSLISYHLPGTLKLPIPPLIVAPIRAVMTRTMPRRDFLKSSSVIKKGMRRTLESLIHEWVGGGYQPVDMVIEAGTFSRRGGLLDIFPPAEKFPVRLDFFGDELDTLRQFDPATQRTVRQLDSIFVTPARELLPSKATHLDLTAEDLHEFYLPLVHPAPASILDYLPVQALVVLDDWGNLSSGALEIEEQAVAIRSEAVADGVLPVDFPIPYQSWSEIEDQLSRHQVLELGRTTAPEQTPWQQMFEPGPRFAGRLKQMVEFIRENCSATDECCVISRQSPRLQELWRENGDSQPDACQPEFIEGALTEGTVLTLPEGRRIYLLTDSEVFGWERPKPRRRVRTVAESPENFYADLQPGDWVVHIDYGIGRFGGLVRRVLDGIEREFLCVEYEGGDQVFVPVHQADRLSRYFGPDNEPPNPTRLGTNEWTQTRERVRQAVQEVARELLDLYARRQVASGHAFSIDTPWQKEMEASFPYIETEDQLAAIAEVKRDMEDVRPMDRLLCGDVGYGKTEVALRAAFKAVNDGKQAALLVPTTVLAQQHYETFRQRLAVYPVNVEMLSRFRTLREQHVILKRLSTGSVDIIIGTHRLIQSDVGFKDLGLVIIDEEQRFGVTHKEHLKKLRTEVDVLTLTATPIPRTLYMALTGVRDISTINTPPEERLPIITHIGPYAPRLVRQAILREMDRGGQVFFVHNRVQTIRGMESHLGQLVPEARIGVAHGQMPEKDLSRVMFEFSHGELDVLLCTSIIESGLDIPNANTLIIDRADTFGLSQLYQLRGRVGRGGLRAYAYFFRHRKRSPTPEGLERMEVIAENSQLGAGYSIAMRDLEMRGAGELLGTRQHGYIASVGFQLYTRLLAQAVRASRTGMDLPKGEAFQAFTRDVGLPVNVDLPLSVGIPLDYITSQQLRLRIYRRLAETREEQQLDQRQEEFTDRFGALPAAVNNLIYQMRVKLRAEKAGLAALMVEGEQIVLRFPPLPEVNNGRLLPPIKGARAGKNAYWLPLTDANDWQTQLLDVLQEIANQSA